MATYPQPGYAPTPANLSRMYPAPSSSPSLIYGSSQTDPRAINYGGQLKPISSLTNPQAANFQGSLTYNYVPGATQRVVGDVLGAAQSSGGGSQQQQSSGPNWSQGLTGEQVRALGLNPDTMIATNGLFYGQGGTSSEEELNNAYNPIFDYLNQAESSVRGAYPSIQQDITNQFGVSAGQLGSSRDMGMASLTSNEAKVQQTKEDAMSAARRLYNELIGGYGQRFGGASSAGEAARTLAGNEAQRTMGGVNRDYGNNIALINQKRVEVEQNYQTGLQQLQASRDTALNQAKRDFDQKLLDIQNTRASTASEKAQQKLAALQELRNQAYNIQLQNQQFQQQLQLQREADTQNLGAYLQGVQGASTTVGQAASNFNPQIASNLQTGGSSVPGQSSMVGSWTLPGSKDELTGSISPQKSALDLYNRIFSSPLQSSLSRR